MRRIIFKTLIFITPVLLFYSMGSLFDSFILNAEMEKKAGSLLPELADNGIVIAGDSRAEKQVIPSIIKEKTGRDCINVAVGSGDLVTTFNLLKQYNCFDEKKLIILSVSIFQINDSSLEPGYMSSAAILRMSLPEQLKLFRGDFVFTYQRIFKDLIYEIKSSYKKRQLWTGDYRLKTRGYYLVNDTREPKRNVNLESIAVDHPWYRKMRLNGVRYRIFREVIRQLGESGASIVIYQPPVSPVWLENTRGTFVDSGERLFGLMLKHECSKYNNVQFIRFYKRKIVGLSNKCYYDTHHLKYEGAKLFTSSLVNKLKVLNVI